MSDPVQRWSMPAVTGPIVAGRRKPTVEQLQTLEEAAYKEAFAQGRDAGILAGRKELEAKLQEAYQCVAKLDAALALLAKPLAELDVQVEQQLAALATMIARQLVRRELKTEPGQIIAVIRETVGLLPAAARDVRIHLHPEDAAIVRERLAMPANERAWTLVEDPVMSRGGCVIRSENSTIDSRLETRLGTVISAVLGDERGSSGPVTTA
jgi:flagellar assembly protein FliH